MAKTVEEKAERFRKRQEAKAKRHKKRKGKVRRFKFGMIIRYLENYVPQRVGAPHYPGRYYGARKRRPQKGGSMSLRTT